MNTKWIIVLVVLIGILLVLYVLGKKSVHHEVIINTSPEQVWRVLTDTDRYDQWNPVMKLVQGEVKEGNKVTYQFTQDPNNISEIAARVQQMVPYQLLNQRGGIPFVLMYDHVYRIEPAGNATKVIIHEDYRGIYVNFWNPKPVAEAYGRLNLALKERVENLEEAKK